MLRNCCRRQNLYLTTKMPENTNFRKRATQTWLGIRTKHKFPRLSRKHFLAENATDTIETSARQRSTLQSIAWVCYLTKDSCLRQCTGAAIDDINTAFVTSCTSPTEQQSSVIEANYSSTSWRCGRCWNDDEESVVMGAVHMCVTKKQSSGDGAKLLSPGRGQQEDSIKKS